LLALPKKEKIEISVVRVQTVTVGADPTQDALIKFTTAAADVTLRLPATVLADLEAMLTHASQAQAEHATKQ
jgi:hypothetical protein